MNVGKGIKLKNIQNGFVSDKYINIKYKYNVTRKKQKNNLCSDEN